MHQSLINPVIQHHSLSNSLSITSINNVITPSSHRRRISYVTVNGKVDSSNVFYGWRQKRNRDPVSFCNGIRVYAESKTEQKQVRKFSRLLESPLLLENNGLISEFKTIPDIWRSSAKKYGDRVALVDPHHDPPTNMTYKQVEQDILDFAEGLRVIGIKPCEKLALFADNSCRWLIADQGIMATGAINVVRGSRSSVEELLHIYIHSESVALVVDNPELYHRIAKAIDFKASVRFVILLWGEISSISIQMMEGVPVFSYNEIINMGREQHVVLVDSHDARNKFDYEPIESDDLATLIYTSGTTGNPKGVMLTHSNLLHQVQNLWDVVPAEPGDRFLSMLPPWHAYERSCGYFILSRGVEQVYTNAKYLKDDMRHYQPQYMISVPLVLQTLYSGIQKQIATSSGIRKLVAVSFIRISMAYMHFKNIYEGKILCRTQKQPSYIAAMLDWLYARLIATVLLPFHILAMKAVYSKIHSSIGISKAAICGGGSLPSHVDKFFEVRNLWELFPVGPEDRYLSMLPPWHAYERSSGYLVLFYGVEQIYTTIRHLKDDLKHYQPHYILSVPLVYQNLYSGIMKQISSSSAIRKLISLSFLNISMAYVQFKNIYEGNILPSNQKQPSYVVAMFEWLYARIIAAMLLPLHLLAEKVVYSKIHSSIGISKSGICGGGSLPLHVDKFYEAIGIKIQAGYGLTESSPTVAGRGNGCYVVGSVGRPIPNTEIKVVHDETGEDLAPGSKGIVKVKGPQVMKGYYKNEIATKQALDKDGWLYTGDIGWISPSYSIGRNRNAGGVIVLEGRAKDTIVLSTGENVEPEQLEEAAMRSSFIQQIVVIGQDERRLGAIIVPNKEEIMSVFGAKLNKEKIAGLLSEELRKWTSECSFQIGPILVIEEPFTIESGLMTATMKIRRNQVMELYKEQINDLYK